MTQKISFTIFKSLYDTNTQKRMNLDNFDQFEELLLNMSKKYIGSKSDAQLISPACYVPKTKRKNVNVTEWGGWAALDVDDWQPEGDLRDAIINRFGKYRFTVYSTASSTTSLPKFRVVFELDHRVQKDNIPKLWHALNTEFDSVGDVQVKDLSRMYYIPGNYKRSPDSLFFFISSDGGKPLPVHDLIDKHPMPERRTSSFFDKLPPEMQERILQKKKDSLENTNYTWSGYRDCPFWPKQLELEYRAITTAGWYHKLYTIMVAIAGHAISKGYPITPKEIEMMIRQFDAETGGWYKDRPIDTEAARALEFVFKNSV